MLYPLSYEGGGRKRLRKRLRKRFQSRFTCQWSIPDRSVLPRLPGIGRRVRWLLDRAVGLGGRIRAVDQIVATVRKGLLLASNDQSGGLCR